MLQTLLCATDLLCCASLVLASGDSPIPTPSEMAAKSSWVATTLDSGTTPPFSFTYGDRSSRDLLPAWTVSRATDETTDARHGRRTAHTLSFTDPATGLVVRCEATEYSDFPTVEWTLHFRNDGTVDTPILSGIRAVDLHLDRPAEGEFVLHTIRGDNCSPASYEPLAWPLGPGVSLHQACTGGRPTQEACPYFHIERPGGGVLLGLGWPGQWEMDFTRDGATGLDVRGGQEATHFLLHPGEEVRSPLVVVQFYEGDWMRAQNVWRRWMLAHNLPMPGGKPLEPHRSLCSGNYFPGLMTVGETEMWFLQRHIEERVPFDLWWQDAGWYPCDSVGWPKTGTWEPDPVRFPNGLRAVSDLVHASGKRSMVWFEPERVAAGTWIADNHPEWVHGGRDGGLLDLGNPECRAWLTDHIDRLLTEQGIDDYRQDFNIDPLGYWRAADGPDRQGIAEIRHVEGYLAYWDALRERHPDMLIDSCASGGRRNDLETLRRAVPLLRSDWYHGPEGQQCLTYGLSLLIPYQGTGVMYQPSADTNWFRSSMVAEMSFGPSPEGLRDLDWDFVRRIVGEHERVAPYFLGDFHPLRPYTQAPDAWMVYQFDRPAIGGGVVQAFRRSRSAYEAGRFPLQGLDPAAEYRLTDLDTGVSTTESGRSLLEQGLRIAIDAPGQSAVVEYRKQ